MSVLWPRCQNLSPVQGGSEHVLVYIYVYVCVCFPHEVCVCVPLCMCMCMCMCMWPRRSDPGPSWDTIVVLWGWVTIRGVGGHAFTASRGMAVDADGRVALQLSAQPLNTHVVMVALQWGAERPQPWRHPIAKVLWRDLRALPATIWQGGAGR